MRFSALITALALAACAGSETKSTSVTKPKVKIAATQEPTATALFAAKGEDMAPRIMYHDDLYTRPELPPVDADILAQLDIKIVNETDVPDQDIRASADASYRQLGIANQELRGWTLSVRPTPDGQMPSTDFNVKGRIIILCMDTSFLPFAGPHELTHALIGPTVRTNLPVSMNEFMATAAELYMPPGAEAPFTYEILNRPILSTGLNPNGDTDTMNAGGAPLDGLRYELLRAVGRKLGPLGYHTLAAQIYQATLKADKLVTVDDLQPLFAAAGVGDCVLFSHNTEPGVYVDVLIGTNHAPMVVTKYIDGQGQESVPDAPVNLTWKRGGLAIRQFQGGQGPIVTDDASIMFNNTMDEYVVTVGGLTYDYQIGHKSPSSTTPEPTTP